MQRFQGELLETAGRDLFQLFSDESSRAAPRASRPMARTMAAPRASGPIAVPWPFCACRGAGAMELALEGLSVRPTFSKLAPSLSVGSQRRTEPAADAAARDVCSRRHGETGRKIST